MFSTCIAASPPISATGSPEKKKYEAIESGEKRNKIKVKAHIDNDIFIILFGVLVFSLIMNAMKASLTGKPHILHSNACGLTKDSHSGQGIRVLALTGNPPLFSVKSPATWKFPEPLLIFWRVSLFCFLVKK